MKLSGDHGPEFVGYGKPELRHHWLNWRGTTTLGAAIFVASLLLMVVL